jgi:hypothetical protein
MRLWSRRGAGVRNWSLLVAIGFGVLVLSAFVPVAHAQVPAACTTSDAAIRKNLETLLVRYDARASALLSNALMSLQIARAHCVGGEIERGLRLYRQIADSLADALALEASRDGEGWEP